MRKNSYIDGLYKLVDQDKLQTMQPLVKLLEQQLLEYFRSLSQAQLSGPHTMNAIIKSGDLKGKYRERPHPQQVAEILTRNGWTKRRLYGVHGGRNLWFPPS